MLDQGINHAIKVKIQMNSKIRWAFKEFLTSKRMAPVEFQLKNGTKVSFRIAVCRRFYDVFLLTFLDELKFQGSQSISA
jgi:hypothetical protein